MALEHAIRVAVVDDHPAIALAVRAAIEGEDAPALPLAFAGAARSVAEANALLAGDVRPDIVLCDLQLQVDVDGLEVIDLAIRAGCKAIVLTSFDRSSLMRAAFERGASGFLDKSIDPVEILAAVREVAGGGTAFSGRALDAARDAPRTPSGREQQILDRLRRGSSSDEIGKDLGISTRTVESHLRRLFDRYGVFSRTELTVFAIQQGWVDADR
jgi:DNA-binding NarL/FixJ family response regulator